LCNEKIKNALIKLLEEFRANPRGPDWGEFPTLAIEALGNFGTRADDDLKKALAKTADFQSSPESSVKAHLLVRRRVACGGPEARSGPHAQAAERAGSVAGTTERKRWPPGDDNRCLESHPCHPRPGESLGHLPEKKVTPWRWTGRGDGGRRRPLGGSTGNQCRSVGA